MTQRLLLAALALTTAALPAAYALGARTAQPDTRVYELRTYTTNPGRLPALEKRFAEHTMRLFEKHGMRNEMYWVPTDSARRDNTLVYVISHESREAADRNWQAFNADTSWQRVRAASEVDGVILAKPPERLFLRRTAWSPNALSPASRK